MPRSKSREPFKKESPPGFSTSHTVRYPWNEWLTLARKGPIELIKGQHFECLPHGMMRNARHALGKAKLKASIKVLEDRITITLLGDM
jgi:hypothetical protein